MVHTCESPPPPPPRAQAAWAHEAFKDHDNPDETKAYNNAIQQKLWKCEEVEKFLEDKFKDNSPLQLAAALFQASQKSTHLFEALKELLPHFYEPSQDDALCAYLHVHGR